MDASTGRSDLAESRQQLAQLLEERMNRAYESLADGQRLERDTSLVKSYLIESPLPEDEADAQRAKDTLRGLLADQFLATRRNAVESSLLTGSDQTLLTVRLRLRNEAFTTYFDVRNPRYWLVHSMGGSGVVDWFVQRLAALGPTLDRAWIPIELLEAVASRGSFRGLGLDFDHRPFLRRRMANADENAAEDHDVAEDDDFLERIEEASSESLDDELAPVEMLKVQLWGNKARYVLELLRSADAFPRQTTLAKVKVKYRLADDTPQYFSLDDVKFDGKVTARGTSFQSHSDLLHVIQDQYAGLLRSIEEQRLEWSGSPSGVRMRGSAVLLLLGQAIENVDQFCATVFSGAEPFRLWGSPVAMGRMRRVHAVDLHVGRRLVVEVGNDFLRVYLPSEACGNSLLRLYTNLQHTFDSKVRMTTSQGADVVAL
jgi:hypothetical protein